MLLIKAVKMNLDQYWGSVSAVIQVSCEEQKVGPWSVGFQFRRTKIEFWGGSCNNYAKI